MTVIWGACLIPASAQRKQHSWRVSFSCLARLSTHPNTFYSLLNKLHLSLSCAFLSFLLSLSYLFLFEPSLQGSVHVFLHLTHLYLDSLSLVMWVVLFLGVFFFVFGLNVCCHAALKFRNLICCFCLQVFFFLTAFFLHFFTFTCLVVYLLGQVLIWETVLCSFFLSILYKVYMCSILPRQ